MVRVFLAIDLPKSLKKELSKLKTEEQAFARLKWVEEENLHLTLFFFGNLPEKEVEKILKVCEKRVKDFPPFELFWSILEQIHDRLSGPLALLA